MPRPAMAESRCSTVSTLTSPLTRVVDMVVSPTFEARAGISTTGSRSVLQNTMPVSTGAGFRVR
ncbi:hypothetical protein D3C76_1513460 [compost metagenome]